MAKYLISDTHFGHNNVLDFERFQFKTIEEHDEYIIKKWNSIIKKDDIVYHLGDVALSSRTSLKDTISRLNGYKILIKGNHDKNTNNFYLRIGFNEVYSHPIYIQDNIILSHQPLLEGYNNTYIINVHGHLHGSILSLDNYICVAVDQINYEPVNLKYILEKARKLKTRKAKFLDEWYAKYYRFYIDKGIYYDKDGNVDIKKTKEVEYYYVNLSYEELCLLNNVCDCIGRIFMGQIDTCNFEFVFKNKYLDELEKTLNQIKMKYDGLPTGMYNGIFAKETNEISKVLYDVHQKLRHQIYLNNLKELKNSVFSEPYFKSSSLLDVYIFKRKGKYIMNVSIEVSDYIMIALELFKAIIIWDVEVIAKYLANYSLQNLEYVFVYNKLNKISKYINDINQEYIDKINILIEIIETSFIK